MHPRLVLAIARKDSIDILLNKSALFGLIMPIVLAILFLFIGKLVGGHTTTILAYNPGQSHLVQVVSGGFDQTMVTEASSPAAVTAAFGPNGSTRDSAYDVGLIIPAHFDSALGAGSRLQVSLYVNGNNVNQQQALLLQAAITNYARQVASPQPPLQISTAMINPPPTANVGNLLGTYYGAVSLLLSFMVGIFLMPGLLIEEKEKKTLRMLMVTPISFTDVILGKLLTALIYQLILSGVVLAIQNAFTGQVSLVLIYAFLGGCFSLALGLLIGGIFSTMSTVGGAASLLFFIYIIPTIFAGPQASLMRGNPVAQIVKVLPPYYIIDGAYNAMQDQGSLGSNLLDIGVILASTLVLLAITAWVLRRQASVAASI